MKKLLCLLSLAGLVLTACQKDPAVDPNSSNGEKVSVSFTAKLPSRLNGLTTYGLVTANTNQGAIENVNFAATYDLRYIMEVWSADGSTMVHREIAIVDNPWQLSTNTSATTFTVRLVPASYKFVFWSDVVTQGSQADLRYSTSSPSLKSISVIGSYLGNDDTKDAYTYSSSLINITGGFSQNITLTRPFGKIRVMATDVTPAVIAAGKAPQAVKLSYAGNVPSAFNAFAGEPIAASNFSSPQYPGLADIANDLGAGTKQTLSWDYIFTPSTGQTGYNFTVEAYDGTNTLIKSRAIANIPAERNKLTTVTGSFLTDAATFTVKVDEAFLPGEINVNIADQVFSPAVIMAAPSDRYATVATVATVDGLTAVGLTADASGATSSRPAGQQGNFYNTQGKNVLVANPLNSTEWEIHGKMYVSADMLATSVGSNPNAKPYYFGIWGADDAYPIIALTNTATDALHAYNTASYNPKWVIYQADGTWIELATPTIGWHAIKIVSTTTGLIEYYINGALVGNYNNLPTAYALHAILLQNYNFSEIQGGQNFPGYSFTGYFSDIQASIN